MNPILKKARSAYRRLKKGCQVALSPEKFYLYQKELYLYHNLSYSQEGEDMILARIFAGKNNGFYVDVGAHHPQRFSNTYYFYLQGWKGINIDAMPGCMDIFTRLRPNDINLEIAIYDSQEILTYYSFNEPALNGFSKEISQTRDGLRQYKIIEQKHIKTYTLSEVLDEYLPSNQTIDFINIDVEGLEYQVLKSNNWGKYRPEVVLVEDLSFLSLKEINKAEVTLFMHEQSYQLYGKTLCTLIFKRKS